MLIAKFFVRALAIALALWWIATASSAEESAPIRIIVGAAPGGTTDTLARTMSKRMGEVLRRTVIVENRAGAAGNIAAEAVARSAPDGNTLLLSFTSHTINASLFKKLPFDPVKDFTPITMVGTSAAVLVAAKNVPANNVAELIAYAKKNPGKLSIGLASVGASTHLAGERLKMLTGINIVNVPYKGTSQAMTDLLAGNVQLLFANTLNVLPHVNGGRLKLLGVTSPKPLKQFPDVRPIAETVKGFESDAWFGLFGPAKMPREVTQRLYEAAKSAIDEPAFVQRLEADGGSPGGMPPEQFATFVVKDVERWAEVVRFTGAVVE